jgi:putative colanic acid biosysnthesis UDP-glucose lipid carrier transferase
MSNHFKICSVWIAGKYSEKIAYLINKPLRKIDYHTGNVSLLPVNEFAVERKTILLHGYIGKKKIYLFFKRCLDIIFSIIFIAGILTWLTPLVGLLILIDSKGPVFFMQWRIGKNGRLFRCIKFRTMIVNDEANERQAHRNDYRITRLGRFLRKTNIDEFPQFINVFFGDMSIIGPRPHMPSDCTRFSFVIPAYKFRTLMRPGITGLAQVKGYHGPTLNYESIFMRYHWDAEYIRNAGFWLDLKIFLLTFLHTLSNVIHLAGSSLIAHKNDEVIL